MISTRRKDKEAIIAMQQRKLWQKYNSTDDPRIKFECISKLHDLTIELANLQYDNYIMQSEKNYNLYNYNYKKSSSPLKRGYKLSNSPNTTTMILSRFINNSDEDLR
jgi:hypothetical protein